jgi:hypothetical protein
MQLNRVPWVKLIEGQFGWLMCSSKLQSGPKLCWFTPDISQASIAK